LAARDGSHTRRENLNGVVFVLDLKLNNDVLSIQEVIGFSNGNAIYNTLSISRDGLPTYTSKNLIGGTFFDTSPSEEEANNEVSRLLRKALESF
jgi:hypothetical protein